MEYSSRKAINFFIIVFFVIRIVKALQALTLTCTLNDHMITCPIIFFSFGFV